MKTFLLLLMAVTLILLSSCKEENNPAVPTGEELGIFYKEIDTSLFKNDFTCLIESRTDTIYDSLGYNRIVQLPNATLVLRDSIFHFDVQVQIYVSLDDKNYMHKGGYGAGSYRINNKKFFTYKVESDTIQKIYIKLSPDENEEQYVKVGIRVKK